MDARLKKIIQKIRDKSLREKITELVENPAIKISGEKFVGLPLESAPAGLSHHHAYPGGFVEHVVATAEIALALCNVVKKVYRGKVNRDFVLAGVVLHDIFKPHTYEINENGSYRAAPLAERVDHLSLVVSELIRRGFPLDVVHIVCAHHGGEFGPIRPKTVEALICHLADVADSKLNGEVLRAARYLMREVGVEEFERINSKEAFAIVYSKAVEGWEGVRKTVEKIRKRRLHAA